MRLNDGHENDFTRGEQLRFNATLVRLNVEVGPVQTPGLPMFQCHPGAIKCLLTAAPWQRISPIRFNATLVRLNALSQDSNAGTRPTVSMPPWCD